MASRSSTSGTALAILFAGGVLLWSGLKGKKVTGAFRDLIAGKNPNTAASTSIQGADSASSVSSSLGVSPGTGVVTGPVGAGEKAFIVAMLAGIGAPPTTANIKSMESWIAHETPWPPDATNNPMNTTTRMPGSTTFNSVGVQNYPTAAEGAAANVATLMNGDYGDILMALRSGRGLCGRNFTGLSTWSGGGYSSVC